MAKLVIKIFTGETFEVENVDLKQFSPRQLIDKMISDDLLANIEGYFYSIDNKDDVAISPEELSHTFEQLGFSDGDVIRIIVFATESRDNDTILDLTEYGDDSVMSPISYARKQHIFSFKEFAPESGEVESPVTEDGDYDIFPDSVNNLYYSSSESANSSESVNNLYYSANSSEFCSFIPRPCPRPCLRISRISDDTLMAPAPNRPDRVVPKFVAGAALGALGATLGAVMGFAPLGAVAGAVVGFAPLGLLGLYRNKKREELACLYGSKREEFVSVYGSIFAPAEVKRKSHMLVQVYLHLFEETEIVMWLAQEAQKEAKRRDYIPLQCKLKIGDKIDVLLNIYGETLLKSEKKGVVWQGSFTKCSFDYFVPNDIDVDELSCVAMLTINGTPVGEMRFVTKIVCAPRQLNTEIVAHKYNKVFISYAHKDKVQVKSFHEGLNLAGIEHFFDRDYLKAGDIFPQMIQDYINSADLFVLFWSENASKSEYVKKERTQALKRAFPQVKPRQAAKLSIYPISIAPRAELPIDMKDYYHFGEL